nr:RNA-directed DNA polymerase, eukaryota, reverse transcriptase zinc-binding domain protein [Tanacetum cinerariifolium]
MVIEMADRPENLKELLINDDINEDLRNFLQDNDLLPDFDTQEVISLFRGSLPGLAKNLLIDVIILENVNKFVEKGLTEVMFSKTIKDHIGLEEDVKKGVLWFLRTTTSLPLRHVYYSFYLCYSLSLYPFTKRYAQPYFFSCLIRQTFKSLCLLNYALMIRHDYDITSSLRRGALQPPSLTLLHYNEIDQLADEYKLGIGKKGHMLNDIWENYKKVQGDNTYWWHDYGLEKIEILKSGLNMKEYAPPKVHVETFEVKRHSFDTGQSFICVNKEKGDTLPL